MKKRIQDYRKTEAFILVCLLLIALCIAPVSAIVVSGAKYMNTISPGKSDVHKITVSLDPGEKATDVQFDVLGFGQASEMNYLTLQPENDLSPYSARKFISISEKTVHIEPGKPQTVTATITLPQDVGSGGRYAIISVHGVAKPGEFISTGINIPVLITISGTKPTETGNIQSVEVADVILGQPIKITTLFKNTGNYHYYNTKNTVTILDAKGNQVSSYSADPTMFAIIPGSTVKYIATPSIQNLPVGTYTVDSKVLHESGTVLNEMSKTFDVKTNYIPPLTESNITLTPGSTGTLTSPDGRYSISFPQGSVLGDATVILKPYSRDQLRDAPDKVKFAATTFEVKGLSGLLNKDATVRVTYSSDDLAAAGGDAAQLKLAYYDAAKGNWVILPTQVDANTKTVTTTTNHMGVWAIMVSSTTSAGTAPGPSTTQSPAPVTTVLASIVFAIIVTGEYFIRKQK